jgi:hypothetical protein
LLIEQAMKVMETKTVITKEFPEENILTKNVQDAERLN